MKSSGEKTAQAFQPNTPVLRSMGLGPEGLLVGAVVTFQDITEKKRMTARTLVEKTKMAEITKLLGNIGHDIKNMLMPVLTGSDHCSVVKSMNFFNQITRALRESRSTEERSKR